MTTSSRSTARSACCGSTSATARRWLEGAAAALNDLPVIKALLFLLTENIFAGQNMGPRDKDNIEVWQAILTAAAREETS